MENNLIGIFPEPVMIRLQRALTQWPKWCAAPPRFVRKIEGGTTNNSIMVEVNRQRYIVRINALNSEALGLDRQLEQAIFQRAAEAGITSTLVYVDPAEQYLVCEYIDGRHLKPCDIGEQVSVVQLAELIKKIHQLPTVNGSLDLKRRASIYWEAIGSGNEYFSELQEIQRWVGPHTRLAESKNTQPCVCHYDLLPENIIVSSEGGLLAIDWEYAAMGDPYFDLAVLIDGLALNTQQTQLLLAAYFGAENCAEQLDRLKHSQIIYQYIALLWYAVQCSQRDDGLYREAFSTRLSQIKNLLK